jgi:DNA-binding GntR family transcriptional regulator
MSAPFYQRIVDDLRARIQSGDWPKGTKIPTTLELREYYRHRFESPTLAIATVERALNILKQDNLLRGQQGLGIFVAGSPTDETDEGP